MVNVLTENPMPTTLAPQDHMIYQKYTKKTLQNKEKNKISLCQENGLDYNKRKALLCLTYPLTEEANIEILQDVMGGILEQDILMIIIGIGNKKYQEFFTKLAIKHPKKLAIISDSPANKEKIYAASDIFLATNSDRECLSEMEKALNYGVIPISTPNELLSDYNAVQEEGNAFIYQQGSPWGFFAALVRTLENFKFPYDWRSIQMNAIGGEELEESEF